MTGEYKGYNAVMTTQKFAKSGSDFFLTGVAFDDSVTADDFYTVGEGLGDINVQAVRQSDNQHFSTTTFGSGGYQIALDPGTYDVTFSGEGLNKTETITISNQNVKLDLETDELPQNPTQATSQQPSTPQQGTNDVIGEYGNVTLNHNWKTVSLEETYNNPVVIVSDPTIRGADPAVIRLRNVGSDQFQLRLQEPNYKDGQHANESVSYMVVEAGDWKLQDGTRLAAGIHKGEILSSQGFDSIDLTGFNATPTVLSQVQTFQDSDWVTTRMTQQSAKRFQLTMQEEEKLNGGSHAQEDIGWFAIDQGTASDGDTLLEGNTTSRSYAHKRSNAANVAFEADFTRTPSVIAKLGSFYGKDTANLRLDRIDVNGFGVRVQEEKSLDNEMTHTNESVSFLALSGQSGLLTGTSV
ncbi:MAG: carboxypeptidase regulatory-like domain-containing protein [Okeania sp. SIO2H7]|nr:carboxypeptidase regulatory-like domain-containing protein [Okeania sp. SIO2H7]